MQTIITTTAITATVSALIGTIVATLITIVKNKGNENINGSKAMKDGMRALLWRELKNIHSEAIKDGINCEELKHLENVYQSYHAIGGNGTGTKLYQEAMNARIEEE